MNNVYSRAVVNIGEMMNREARASCIVLPYCSPHRRGFFFSASDDWDCLEKSALCQTLIAHLDTFCGRFYI